MENLNLDIKNIRSKASTVIDQNKIYKESVDTVINSLLNVDTVWIDDDTETFLNVIKNDRVSFDEFDSSIDENVNLSVKFCDYLDSYLANIFNVGSLSKIKYINRITTRSIDTLEIIRTRVNNIKDSINTLSIPSSTVYSSDIRNLFNDVDLSSVNSAEGKIDSAIKSIEKAVNAAKNDASSIKEKIIDDSYLGFSSSIEAGKSEKLSSIVNETIKNTVSTFSNNFTNANDGSSNGVIDLNETQSNLVSDNEVSSSSSSVDSSNSTSIETLNEKIESSDVSITSNSSSSMSTNLNNIDNELTSSGTSVDVSSQGSVNLNINENELSASETNNNESSNSTINLNTTENELSASEANNNESSNSTINLNTTENELSASETNNNESSNSTINLNTLDNGLTASENNVNSLFGDSINLNTTTTDFQASSSTIN